MQRLRACILGILVFSIVGTGLELMLLRHYDTAWKVVPLALCGAALAALLARLRWPGNPAMRVFAVVMALFVISGVVGIYLHYQGKAEFARERDPSLRGWSMLREAVLTGSTPPLLAPGTMMALGLLGLAWSHAAGHDARANRDTQGDAR